MDKDIDVKLLNPAIFKDDLIRGNQKHVPVSNIKP